MRKDEKRCFLCGSEVNQNPDKITLRQRLNSVVKVLLIVSLVMTIASIFTDYVPSFTKCLVFTMVLGLVKNSSEQMEAHR